MREGVLVWVSPTERPTSARFDELASQTGANMKKGTLASLVCGLKPRLGFSPWIKVPTGGGTALFDDHAIRAIQHAFCPPETI